MADNPGNCHKSGKELRVKDNRSVYESIVLIMQFGINMIVPILMCTVLGVWVAEKTGWKILVVPLFLIGALAGMRNCYVLVKRMIDREKSNKGSREIASEIVAQAKKEEIKDVKKN